MSDILYSKLRLEVPSALNGENATITSERGNSRVVQMTSPITDIMLAGMEKYRVQAGTTDENVSFGYGEIKKVEAKSRSILKKLPYSSWINNSVVYNNEIHLLGGAGNGTKHYKWNGNSWVSVSTLPYNFARGAAVVYNNEIHILGGLGVNYDGDTYHYKWNGSSWESVSTLPYKCYDFSAVVYGNQIHILGGYNGSGFLSHYKWNGSRWVSISTLPYNVPYCTAVVWNNEIHLLGGSSGIYSTKYHYKWNGSAWTSVSTLPYEFTEYGAAVVYNNEIHILGSGYSTSSPTTYPNVTKHYKWNGSSWTSVSTLPYDFRGRAVVWYDGLSNNIVLIGEKDTPYNKDAQWDGTSWTIGED